MNIKVIKTAIYVVASIIIISGLFVTADYFELFGTTVEKRLSFAEVRFRTVDAESKGLIMNAGVRCFQKNNMNACTLKNSHKVGIVSVNIPVQRAVKKTLLFKKAEEIYKSIDPKINIMIIHDDYYNPTVKLLMEDIYSNKLSEQLIEMTPRDWGDQENAEEES